MEVSEEIVMVNSSRLKSVVWNDFDRVKKGDTCLAICRHCKSKLSGSSNSGTSHLRNHLIRCRRSLNHDITQLVTREKKKESPYSVKKVSLDHENQKAEAVTIASIQYEQAYAVDRNTVNGSFSFSHKHDGYDIARMIIFHGYPLSMVEDIGFRIFVRNLQPFFDLDSLDRVEADCKELYKKEKQKVFEELDGLPGRISLSSDMWSSHGGTEFLCLAAHYVDEAWKLKKKILNFITIDPTQSKDMLAEVIVSSIRKWDIDRKLFSMTFDNNTAHDDILCRIRDQLCQHKFLLCDGQLFDTRCASDMVNLMVLDILENSYQIIHKIRESIRYVKSSQATQAKFSEIIETVGDDSQRRLCLDNQSNWNSTFMMLDTALEYKDVFPLLQEQDPEYLTCPSGKEWERANAIRDFLKHFLEVTNLFVEIKVPTANTYFAVICDVHLQLIEWYQSTDEFVHESALELKNKFGEYWKKCSLALAIATILDPRFKMKLVEYYYPQIHGSNSSEYIKTVSDCMKALYDSHAIYSPLVSPDRSSGSQDRLTGFDRYVHETSQSQNIKSDLDKYLEEPLFPRNAYFDILSWWSVHTPRYPILSRMARNILGTPMSKVQSEYAYNTGSKELDHYRSSLTSDTLQALVCTQDWMSRELGDT